MIARSLPVKLAAILAATGVHAALVVGLAGPEPIRMEGQGAAAEARLGTSFRDLVAGGVASPAPPERIAPARPALSPVSVTRSEADGPLTHRAERAETLSPVETADILPAESPGRLAATRAEAILPVRPSAAPAPRLRPEYSLTATTESSPAPAGGAPMQAQPVRPEDVPARTDPAVLAHRPPEAAIRAETEIAAAPVRSLRPTVRPADIEPPPRPAADPPPPAPSAPGNAPRDADAGAAVGRSEAPAASSGAGRTPSAAGNAAANSYPGEVMRCISRAGRPRVSARGTAVVSFRISANGRVTGAALAASSGDAGLDRAAVRTIAGAGPCPAPPQGARTAFSIRVQGR